MRNRFTICMYSGRVPPETEMSKEASFKALELACLALKINEPYRGPVQIAPSSESYAVRWIPASPVPPPLVGVMSHSSGMLRVYPSNGELGLVIKDVVGLWAHLAKTGGPLLAAHIEECNKQMKEYWEQTVIPLTK